MTPALLLSALGAGIAAFAVGVRVGRAQAVSDAKWQIDHLAAKWKRERTEPPTKRVVPRGGGLFQ